jgi:Protein of unknown function (DUF4435)
MRTISSLPPELTRILFDAGNRIVVLVEGEDDREVLREWFEEERVEVEFYDCGGIVTLTKWLTELLTLGTLKRAYGITDRDFRSDEEVAASHTETSHQFILHRYAMENYLLETKTLWEVLKERYPEVTKNLPDENAMAENLLQRCELLKSIMAANWVFFDKNKAQQQATGETAKLEYFTTGHALERHIVMQQAVIEMQCSEADAETLITEKEQFIESRLSQLATAHQVIDGKRLLHWVQREQFKTGEDYFRRRLMREAKTQGLPADIVDIIQEKIIRRSNKHSA